MRRDWFIMIVLLILFLALWSRFPAPEPMLPVLPPEPASVPPAGEVSAAPSPAAELRWPILNLPEWSVVERQQRRWLHSPDGMVWDWPPPQPLTWRSQEWFFLAIGASAQPVFVAYPVDLAVVTRHNHQCVVIQWLTDGSTLRVDASGRVQAQPPSQRMLPGVEP